MAPPKLALSKLGKTAKYYRNNPKARKKKAETDTRINQRPEQKAKKTELARARTKYKKKGISLKGKDISHTKNGLVLKSTKSNRGSKGDTKGDRNARG